MNQPAHDLAAPAERESLDLLLERLLEAIDSLSVADLLALVELDALAYPEPIVDPAEREARLALLLRSCSEDKLYRWMAVSDSATVSFCQSLLSRRLRVDRQPIIGLLDSLALWRNSNRVLVPNISLLQQVLDHLPESAAAAGQTLKTSLLHSGRYSQAWLEGAAATPDPR